MRPEELEHYQMQETLQKQQLDAQSEQYAPQVYQDMQQTKAVLVDETNPKRVVSNILRRLRGLEEQHDGTMQEVAKPKMNEVGISNIWFILDSHINQNVILSNLDDKEIRGMMDSISEDLVDDLTLNWKEYGIEKRTDLDTINNSILVNIFLSLKRAEHQGEKNWLKGITQENVSAGSRIPSIKKESFWSKFR